MNVTLRLPTNSSLKLVSADGTVSAEGRSYYDAIGINPPTIFAYEQPLINNKWVNAFAGTAKMVQRMTTDGWGPTKIGIEHFKYNKLSFRNEFPATNSKANCQRKKTG